MKTGSKQFVFTDFKKGLKNINEETLLNIENNVNLDPVLKNAFRYLKENNISLSHLAMELKEDFSEEKCVSVNSESESEQKQIAVNTLESGQARQDDNV